MVVKRMSILHELQKVFKGIAVCVTSLELKNHNSYSFFVLHYSEQTLVQE